MRIFDFGVRTESEEGETENKLVRTFRGLATFAYRNLRMNMADVAVEAYPNKVLPVWTKDKKTGEWQKTERKGYIAKNVWLPGKGKKPKGNS